MATAKHLLLTITCISARLVAAAEADAVLLYDFTKKPGASARDLSGRGNDGRISNAGWAGNSLYFNGRDTTVTAPSSPSLKVTSELSVEAWVFITDYPSHEAYILAKDGCYTDGYGFALQTSGQVRFKLDGKNRWLRTTKSLELGRWNHLVGTFSLAQKRMTLYLDAEPQGTKSSADGVITSAKPFIIGNRHIRQQNEHFKGYIRRVRVLTRALTAEEVRRAFRSMVAELKEPSQPAVIAESVVTRRAAPQPGVEAIAPPRSFAVEGGRPHRLSVRVRGRFSKGRVGYRIVLLDAAKRKATGKRLESFPLTPRSSGETWQTLNDSFYVNADTRAIEVHMLARGIDGQMEGGEVSLAPTDQKEITLPPRLSDFPVDYDWQRFPCPPHPRLYFAEADWARLRRESREGPKAKIWQTVRVEIERSFHDDAPDSYERPWAYPGYEDPKWRRMFNAIYDDAFRRGLRYCETNAFAYRLTGEGRYLDNARRWMLRPCRWEHWCLHENGKHVWSSYDLCVCHKLQGLATAYDWLYHELSEGDRKLVRDTLAKWSELSFEHMYRSGWTSMGNHLGPQLAGQAVAAIALLGEHPDAPRWLNQCLWQMKFHALRRPFMGRDGGLVEGYRFTSYIMNYLTSVAHAVKTLTGMQLLERRLIDWPLYGIIPPDKMVDLESSSYHRPYYYLRPYMMRLASEFRDGHAQWWVESGRRQHGVDAASRGNLWSFIYFDPTVQAKRPDDLLASKHFRDIGWVYLRSGWRPNDFYFVLKSGPQDAKAFRNQNHIILSALGERFIEVPQVSRLFKYPTEANNTILVDGKGQRLGHTGRERTGQDPPMGEIASCFLSPGFDFAVGDAHRAYERKGRTLRKFVRNVAFVKPRYVVMLDDLEAFNEEPVEFESLIRFAGDVRPEGSSTILSGTNAALLTRVLLPRDVEFRTRQATAPEQIQYQKLLEADGGVVIERDGPNGVPCVTARHTNRWGYLEATLPIRAYRSGERPSHLRLACRAVTTGRIRFALQLSSSPPAWSWHSPKLCSPGGWQQFEFTIPVPPSKVVQALKLSVFSGEGSDRLRLSDLHVVPPDGSDLFVAESIAKPVQVKEATRTGTVAYTPFAFVPGQKRSREQFLMVFQPLKSLTASRPRIRLAKGSLPGTVVETDGRTDIVVFDGQGTGETERLRMKGRCAFISRTKASGVTAFAAADATLLAIDDHVLFTSSVSASIDTQCHGSRMLVTIDANAATEVGLRLPADAAVIRVDDEPAQRNAVSHDAAGLTRLRFAAGRHTVQAERRDQ